MVAKFNKIIFAENSKPTWLKRIYPTWLPNTQPNSATRENDKNRKMKKINQRNTKNSSFRGG